MSFGILPIEDIKSCGASADKSTDQNIADVPIGDTISRAEAVEVVHRHFLQAIDEEPHTINEDGYDVFTNMASVNALLQHNKIISKQLKALQSAEQVTIKQKSVEISTDKGDKSTMSQPNGKLDLISRAEAIKAVMAEGRNVHASEYANAERIIHEADVVEALAMLPSAEPSEQYKKGFEDAKRAFELEYARESENMRKRNAELEVILNAYRETSAETSDLISRQAVLELFPINVYYDRIAEQVKALPSVDRPITKDTQCQEKNDHSGEVTEMVDLISRQLLIGAIEKCGEEKIYPQALIETIKALPSADRPTLKQTDTMIIADALRYLADDDERHELDRARAEELRKQILKYGASMCHSADAEQNVIRSKTLMPTKDFKEWAKRIREVNPNAVVIPCDAEVVSADRQKGEWIEVYDFVHLAWECSKCGAITSVMTPFCYECGADMRGGKDG